MAIETAATLYPDNATTVDTGAGIDVRRLNATAPAQNDSQSVVFTHTNDNVERTFDPANTGISANNNASTLQRLGYALQLIPDMTPTDDINCDAFLVAQSVTVNINSAANASGGTYVAGTYTPTMRASLWQYNPATDAGALIATGTDTSQSWTVGALGNLGTFLVSPVSLTIPATQFSQGSVLLLQIGLNTGTVPNPTLGTANWTHTLRLGPTSLVFAVKGVRTLCPTVGTSTGSGTAFANAAQIKPTIGTATGTGAAIAVAGATKGTTGTAAGSGQALGQLAAVKGTVGTAAGAGQAVANLAVVKGTVGTINVSEGGGTVVHRRITIRER